MQPNEKRGHVGIMADDCLIIESQTNKYYSKTPRYEITIYYIDGKKISPGLMKILKMDRYIEK